MNEVVNVEMNTMLNYTEEVEEEGMRDDDMIRISLRSGLKRWRICILWMRLMIFWIQLLVKL